MKHPLSAITNQRDESQRHKVSLKNRLQEESHAINKNNSMIIVKPNKSQSKLMVVYQRAYRLGHTQHRSQQDQDEKEEGLVSDQSQNHKRECIVGHHDAPQESDQ